MCLRRLISTRPIQYRSRRLRSCVCSTAASRRRRPPAGPRNQSHVAPSANAAGSKDSERCWLKRGCLFRSSLAISLCLDVSFFALSARYSAMAFLILPSLSASLKRSAVANIHHVVWAKFHNVRPQSSRLKPPGYGLTDAVNGKLWPPLNITLPVTMVPGTPAEPTEAVQTAWAPTGMTP